MESKLPKPPLKVGITGGIGSGKTTACRVFEALGIPVYYADDRAKWLMAHDEALLEKIKRIFGEDAYDKSGQLNRPYIARLAFGHQELLDQLNAAVHPAVGKDAEAWHEQQSGVPYTLKEAALLYESGSFEGLHAVIVVTAPQALRLERVMARDGVEEEAVRARMRKQMPEEEKARRADFLIHNDGAQSIVQQIHAIHQELKDRYDKI
ncbi:MAG: dephospho-CoA kinase [Phaeodactylibacter sp.]|uniref:dephospho-CoA kinase n=1 Tax=Phaeodactylibacter sp. TaxID=1940289 RepID=UPI0032EF02D1